MNVKKMRLMFRNCLLLSTYRKYHKKNKDCDVKNNIDEFTNEFIRLYKSSHKNATYLNISTFDKKVGIVSVTRTRNDDIYCFEFNFKSINNVSEKLKTNENKQECCICYELTDTTLSCDHPICKDCCIEMVKVKNNINYHSHSTIIDNDSKNELLCPYCRKDVKIDTYKIKKEIKIT
jgi:hypothetical protein